MDKLKVYFDGACHVCSHEMSHYHRLAPQAFSWVNVSDPAFSPQKEGLDPEAVQRKMHVRTSLGELKSGVDAFVELWKVLPRYRWLVPLVQFPLLRPFCDLGYFVFAEGIRPLLPKKRTCDWPRR